MGSGKLSDINIEKDLLKYRTKKIRNLIINLRSNYKILENNIKVLVRTKYKLKTTIKILWKLKNNKYRTAIIPVTKFIYVFGVLFETEKIIVDLGSGYFSIKNLKQVEQFLERKKKKVKKTIIKEEQKKSIL